MVASPPSLITFSALALASLQSMMAAPLESNPVTTVGDVVSLDRLHPAYGAKPPAESLAYRTVLHNEPVAATNASTNAQRKLEATNQDIQRLEAHFGQRMERNFKTLSQAQYKSAEFEPVPWPSSYWPVYQDGINHRWKNGEVSPAEKYAQAFGKNVREFTDRISQNNGILSQRNRRQCTSNAECAGLNDGSICGRRRGENRGYCIPGWFGICHAWAPAAIMEPEPRCKVNKGDVQFHPFDIKALLTQVWDGANVGTVFTGVRYNGPDAPENTDQFGRFKDAARRDIGPGFFHIAMTNIMARFKKSFVVDVSSGSQVWNQPVRKYEVLQMEEVDPTKITQELYKVDKYPFNSEAKKLALVRTRFSWIVEGTAEGPLVHTGLTGDYTRSADYTYLLELDGDYNIIGGEWIKDSNKEHPDFLWLPVGRPQENMVTNVGLSYKDVHELLDASIRCENLPGNNSTRPVTQPPAPSQPAPLPNPVPGPRPVPGPGPRPVPGPGPRPVPGPGPRPVPGPGPRPVSGPGPRPVPGPVPAQGGLYEYIGTHPDRTGYTRWCNQNCPFNCPSHMCRKRAAWDDSNDNSNSIENSNDNHNNVWVNHGGNNRPNNNGSNNRPDPYNNGGNNVHHNGGNWNHHTSGRRYRYIGSHHDRAGYTRWCNQNCPYFCPSHMCALA